MSTRSESVHDTLSRRDSRSHPVRGSVGFCLALLSLASGACSGTDSGPASSVDMAAVAADMTAGPGSDGGSASANTTADALTAFVKAGSYKTWKAEPAIHASTGPHGGNVRTYVNDVLYASLKAGNTNHPKGSIVVKELYGSGMSSLTGHAVDIKDEQTGEWVFYEGFAPGYSGPYYFRGTTNFCASCHSAGLDYVLTKPSAL